MPTEATCMIRPLGRYTCGKSIAPTRDGMPCGSDPHPQPLEVLELTMVAEENMRSGANSEALQLLKWTRIATPSVLPDVLGTCGRESDPVRLRVRGTCHHQLPQARIAPWKSCGKAGSCQGEYLEACANYDVLG